VGVQNGFFFLFPLSFFSAFEVHNKVERLYLLAPLPVVICNGLRTGNVRKLNGRMK